MTDSPLFIYSPNKRLASAVGVLFLLCFLFLAQPVIAQTDSSAEEVSVFLNVQGIGTAEFPAAIKNEKAYLSVTDLFDFLKIKNTPSGGFDSIPGFLLNPQDQFLIDRVHNRITFHDKVFDLQPSDFVLTATNLYLKSDYFDLVFGLKCTFSFRSLSVMLTTKLELPVIREKRQEMMRTNINHLTGDVKADTVIRRNYPLFRLGMADWSASVASYLPGSSNTLLNLVLGSVIAGGDANIALNYNNSTPFALRDQFFQWRTVNNDHNYLRQTTAGKIFAQSISTIYSPLIGAQFTNTPTTNRRAFGSYILSNYTDPGWMVELYVNNELINYKKADASGFYTFNVPMVYGNSIVKLRFYGPWGEERSSEQNMVIPFNFLPVHQFEYTASAGVVQDTLNSKFSRIDMHYGLSRRLTVGGGFEYLSTATSSHKIPFASASLRVTSNLLVSAEYDHDVQAKALVSYHLPNDLQVDLNYTRYKKGQTAINNSYVEERKAVFSLPLRGKKYSAYSRLTIYQAVFPEFKYTTVEGLLSGVAYGLNTNFTTYAMFTQSATPYVYSNISTVLKLPKRISFTPQLQYEYNSNRIMGIRGEFGKYLSARSYMNVSYENNFKSNFQSIGLDFHYDFSFTQIGFSALHTNNSSTLLASARGSLLYDATSNHLGLSRISSVGRGGLVLLPYLDLNNNGIRDDGEPKVEGFKVQVNGGNVEYNKKDTLTRITNLEPYINYMIRMVPTFNNIALLIKKQTISIAVTPNQFRMVEIPVNVINEVSGTVNIKSKDGEKGQGRIIVSFYNKRSKLVGSLLSEADGFFSYTALSPGSYTARIDSAQLHNLQMESVPAIFPFKIVANKDGDVVDGLKFDLLSTAATLPEIPKSTPPVIIPEKSRMDAPHISKDTPRIAVKPIYRKTNTHKPVAIPKKIIAVPQKELIQKKELDYIKQEKIPGFESWQFGKSDSLFNIGYMNWLK